MNAETSECFMCDIAAGRDTGEWYDRALMATDEAVVMPALGAIVPGHVLVVPRRHVRSVQLLDEASRTDFIHLLRDASTRIERAVGQEVTVFEHGASVAGSGPRSACSEHAHLQVLPGAFDQGAKLQGSVCYSSVAEFCSAEPPFDPYLMIREPGKQTLVARDMGISQYFRREILTGAGEPDNWDYWLFPREENMRATFAMFDWQPEG